jgi:hypothetical protein
MKDGTVPVGYACVSFSNGVLVDGLHESRRAILLGRLEDGKIRQWKVFYWADILADFVSSLDINKKAGSLDIVGKAYRFLSAEWISPHQAEIHVYSKGLGIDNMLDLDVSSQKLSWSQSRPYQIRLAKDEDLIRSIHSGSLLLSYDSSNGNIYKIDRDRGEQHIYLGTIKCSIRNIFSIYWFDSETIIAKSNCLVVYTSGAHSRMYIESGLARMMTWAIARDKEGLIVVLAMDSDNPPPLDVPIKTYTLQALIPREK